MIYLLILTLISCVRIDCHTVSTAIFKGISAEDALHYVQSREAAMRNPKFMQFLVEKATKGEMKFKSNHSAVYDSFDITPPNEFIKRTDVNIDFRRYTLTADRGLIPGPPTNISISINEFKDWYEEFKKCQQ